MVTIEPVDNPYGVQLFPVTSPSGSVINLQNEGEAEWYQNQARRYLEDNRFTNISDIEELSRLLTCEIMIYRWSMWITQGFDYMLARVNEVELKNSIREYSTEVRQIKQALGIDRATREKDKGETLGDYIQTLLKRAKEHGVHRNEQYSKAVTYIWALVSQVRTYDRCDEQERRELDLSPEKMIDWFRETVIPEWEQLNEDYRKEQQIWIKDI